MIHKYTAPFMIALTVLGLGLAGCKKEEAKAAAPKTTEPVGSGSGSAVAKPEPKPEPTPEPVPVDPKADYVRILASHANPKPDDPATIEIKSFKVVKADFDPAKVEGGTAELALDLTSISSNSAKRDNHLKTADYLAVDQFGVASIKIDNVKKTGDNAYSADALVGIHGVEKKLAVAFTVVETLPDGIRIQGEHVFNRHDFSIGKPEGGDDSAASEQKIQLQLTLKKT